jgi:hypothetical protein
LLCYFLFKLKASFEYKSKFRILTVSVEADDQEKQVSILVDHRATVADVINIVSMSNPTLEEESFSLFYQYGVALKPTAIAQDIPVKETLEYRVTPKQIRVSPAYDPSTVQVFDVDFTKPLKEYLPTICRRFGIILSDFALLDKQQGGRKNMLTHTHTLFFFFFQPFSLSPHFYFR